jgi:predicted TIM-barrel fold metal-dependent hydrolase
MRNSDMRRRIFLASKFIYTGTLDKYPNLQIVLPHAGCAFPYRAGTRGAFPLSHE